MDKIQKSRYKSYKEGSVVPDLEDFFVSTINYLVFRKCTPEWRIKPHIVSRYDVTYLIKGSARYMINGKTHELSAGDVLCLHEGLKKEAVTYPDRLMHCFSVNFQLNRFSGEQIFPPLLMINHIGIRDDIIRYFHEFTDTWIDHLPGYGIKSQGLLLLILHRLLELTVYKSTNSWDFRIEQAARYIAQNFAKRLTVKKLAAQANLNDAYFGSLFKQETGLSINQYVAKIRIRNAENILRSGVYKVKDVAEQCGYKDMYYFYKQFKAITGLPPSKYFPERNTK
jgi:AraC-like DNA-binding protein